MHTLVLDPTSHNQVLYAATTNAGVWKTTDAGQSWRQASIGIGNPLPPKPNGNLANQVLALDGNNPNRLLFATQGDDGRFLLAGDGAFVTPYGGLYVSTNGAKTWRHAELSAGAIGGLCPDPTAPGPGPGPSGEISSVAFSSGQPFVAASCGLFTNPDPGLADGQWTKLLNLPFAPAGAIIAPNSYGTVLFVCTGSQVYRSTALGASTTPGGGWNTQPVSLGAGTTCQGLSVVPEAEFVPDTVAIVFAYSTPNMAPKSPTPHWDVSVLSFGSSPPIDLGFNSVATPGGSGGANVFTVRRASASTQDNRPGFGYDVYAADGWSFFLYLPNGNSTGQTPGWKPLRGTNGTLHADSWSMAFPSGYDPDGVNCGAYTSDDGGVFFNSSSAIVFTTTFVGPFPIFLPACDPSGGWLASMSGLHTLASYGMKGVARASCAGAPDCPMVYLATGDNDVWPIANTGPNTAPLGDGLGDAGDVHVDPALPNLVIVTRGSCGGLANLASDAVNAPGPGAAISGVSPSPSGSNPACGTVFSDGAIGPGNPFMSQVMAQSGEIAPLYFAAESPPGATADVIVSSAVNPPTSLNWVSAEAPAVKGFFDQTTNGREARIQSTGGIISPVIWVESGSPAGKGKLYTGAVAASSGKVSSWLNASGTPPPPGNPPQYVDNAASFFVNPYNPNFAWALDLTTQTIMATSDGGKTWNSDLKLTNTATNHGVFRVGCSTGFELMFAWSCSLAWMSFSQNSHSTVVAALYPGGVVYSNDNGQSWALVYSGIPNAAQPQVPQPDMVTLPISVWYDDGVASGRRSIYVGLHGHGVIRIDGDFDALPKL